MNEIIERIKEKIKNCKTSTQEDRARKGAYVDCIVMIKESGNLPEANRNAVLGEVRAMQGYEPDYGEFMTTQSDGRWIEKDEVIKILEKHFA
jgi:hypothetical protein